MTSIDFATDGARDSADSRIRALFRCFMLIREKKGKVLKERKKRRRVKRKGKKRERSKGKYRKKKQEKEEEKEGGGEQERALAHQIRPKAPFFE